MSKSYIEEYVLKYRLEYRKLNDAWKRALVGSNAPRLRMLPIIIVSIPARTNLVPANKICVHVSPDGMLKSAYPSFMHGDALPHRNVHTSASAHTTHVFCKICVLLTALVVFFIISPFCRDNSFGLSYYDARGKRSFTHMSSLIGV